MSLIVDPDHLIHSLRLAYLKRIDDHYGPRIITFPSRSARQEVTRSHHADAGTSMSTSSSTTSFFASSSVQLPREDATTRSSYNDFGADSHVVIAGLTDTSRHPELATVYSPVPTVGDAGPFGGFASKQGRTSIPAKL